MTLDATAQWTAFVLSTLLAVGGALGMATTMSMFRSGIFLMASFLGVAGLFILLSADLLSLLQVMMYIGGMLVMVLFMVLFSHDPGGSMMAGMDMSPVERFFTLGIRPMEMSHGGSEEHSGGAMDDREEGSGEDHGGHQEPADGDGGHQESGDQEGHQGGHAMDMSMTTPLKRPAAAVGALAAALLSALILLRSSWPLSGVLPADDSARQVGNLLMGPYMIAFEGAGLLILLGIFGSVLVGRPALRPDEAARQARVAVDQPPAPAAGPVVEPEVADRDEDPSVAVPAVHGDEGG